MMLLGTPEISDAATITGSQSVGDMTIGNLQKRSLQRLYRTTDLTPQINIDLQSAQNITFISLIAHNGGGTVTVRAGNTAEVSDYASDALNLITGADCGYDSNLFLLGLDQTYRYWQLDIDDSANTEGYFQAGRLYMGQGFQPTINIDYGMADGFIDNTKVTRTRSGEPVPTRRAPIKVQEFKLGFGSEDEMYGTLYDIDRLRGSAKDVLFVKDANATTHFQRQHIYGLMTELQPIIHRSYSIFEKSYRIEEIPA